MPQAPRKKLARTGKPKRHQSHLKKALRKIFNGIEDLKDLADQKRQFTIDGRLVGDIGEFVASKDYALTLHPKSRPGYDGETFDKRSVQIKATFQDHLTYRSRCELYLGLKFEPDGTYEEIYNGPGRLIHQRFKHRKGIGSKLLAFPVSTLRELSRRVPKHQRVRKRAK